MHSLGSGTCGCLLWQELTVIGANKLGVQGPASRLSSRGPRAFCRKGPGQRPCLPTFLAPPEPRPSQCMGHRSSMVERSQGWTRRSAVGMNSDSDPDSGQITSLTQFPHLPTRATIGLTH